jgi:hypothetical protein
VQRKKRVVVGCLSIVGLVLAGVGMLVSLNWDAVSRDLAETVDVQTKRTQATLFRLGELMSISAELKSEYGAEPDVSYSTGTDGRILSITLSDYQVPKKVTAEDHAREIAAFAIGQTKKFEEIDRVDVLFRTSAGGLEAFSFALDELTVRSRDESLESLWSCTTAGVLASISTGSRYRC